MHSTLETILLSHETTEGALEHLANLEEAGELAPLVMSDTLNRFIRGAEDGAWCNRDWQGKTLPYPGNRWRDIQWHYWPAVLVVRESCLSYLAPATVDLLPPPDKVTRTTRIIEPGELATIRGELWQGWRSWMQHDYQRANNMIQRARHAIRTLPQEVTAA